MSQYTLDELDEFNFTILQQVMFFGNTIKEMREINPNGIIDTWIKLDHQFTKEIKK